MTPELYISGKTFEEVDELLTEQADMVIISSEGAAFTLDKEPVVLLDDHRLVISDEGLRILKEDYGVKIEHGR